MTDTHNNEPYATLKDGAVRVKLWERGSGDKSFVTASVYKIYKDKQSGQWKQTNSMGETDLLKLQAMIPQARQIIQEHKRERSAGRQQQAQPDAPEAPEASEQNMEEARAQAMEKASKPEPKRSRSKSRQR